VVLWAVGWVVWPQRLKQQHEEQQRRRPQQRTDSVIWDEASCSFGVGLNFGLGSSAVGLVRAGPLHALANSLRHSETRSFSKSYAPWCMHQLGVPVELSHTLSSCQPVLQQTVCRVHDLDDHAHVFCVPCRVMSSMQQMCAATKGSRKSEPTRRKAALG
jgi:hypothetical protein